MKRNLTPLLLLFCTCWAAGQGFSSEPQVSEAVKRVEEAQIKNIGKKYFIMFGRKDCIHPFIFPILSSPSINDTRKYVAKEPTAFTIDSIVSAEYSKYSKYYQVTIADGTYGYIDTGALKIDNPDFEFTLRRGCVFEIPPEEIERRLAKIEADAQVRAKEDREQSAKDQARREAIAKRPGAKIGMTAKEVVEKTNWGEPESINRTVTQNGAMEQWVYGNSHYLYFRNGRLTSIQNRSEK